MKALVSAVLVLLCLRSPAQPRLEGKALQDSLLRELPASGNDTAGVALLLNLADNYSSSQIDSSLLFAERALALARSIKWREGEALALNNIGLAHRNRAAYPAALEAFFKSLRIHESLKNRKRHGTVLGNIGTVYFYQESYGTAKNYFNKGLAEVRAAGDSVMAVVILGNMGAMAYAQGNFGEALTYIRGALDGAEKLGDTRSVITQLGNLGNVYGDMGDHETALTWYSKALAAARQSNDKHLAVANEANIGITHLDLARDTGRTSSQAAKSAHLAEAIVYLERALDNARAIQFTDAVLEILTKLSETYSLLGDYRKSLQAYRQYTALKDSTFNLQNNRLIADLETKRAVELKNKDLQIAKLAVAKKRNERGFFITGIAALLIVLGLLFRHSKRQGHTNALLSKEKDRSDALLRNILPAEIAEELKETGTASARQYSDVSVIFTDFVDFTTTAQNLTPQAVLQELNECFTAFDAIIERAGLEKIKTIGDAYMAVSGLPQPDPQHACHAVSAGVEILRFIEARRAKQTALDIRIGIHSGPVVAGIVGVKKFAYDIWGDTVNTAARMEQHGVEGAINISQATYDLVKNDFACTYRGRVAAKHKGEVEMYLVSPVPKG